jgi:hypothetical protein
LPTLPDVIAVTPRFGPPLMRSTRATLRRIESVQLRAAKTPNAVRLVLIFE